MFSRKKRSVSNPPARRQQPAPVVSSAASVAASAAFLNTQRSRNNSLSSAAAAAALRSATTSPVPVGDVRTKRMVRRDSNSSVTSASLGSQRQPFSSGVQRRGSSSSMTERSFRSPSPGRSNGVSQTTGEPIPPVPPIPSRSARRTSSTSDMPSPRLDTSVGNGQATENTENTGKKRAPRPASVMSNGYFEQAQGSPTGQSSPRNINFSRPMSPGPTTTSPRGSAPFHTGPQVNVQTRPASTLGFTRDRDQAAARLSNPAATAARASAANAKPASSTGPTPEQIRAYQARAASLLARPRAQEEGEIVYRPPPSAPSSKANRTSSLLNPNTSSTARQAQQKAQVAQPQRSSSAAGHTRAGSQPINKAQSPASIARSMSVSPARSAHFSDTPITEGVKHQPPIRAISPYKSALKSSSRPQSPSLRASGSVAGSETGSVLSDDGSVAARMKKNARVSFEERPIVVGESAAGLPAGPSNQRGPGFKDEEYTGMGGAPVLPSFGSVRSAKAAEEVAPSGIHNTAASVFKEPTDKDDAAMASVSGAPSIAVQPATPLPDESARKQLESPRSSGEIEPGRPSLEDMMSAEGYADVTKSRPIESPPSSPSKATFAPASPSSNIATVPTTTEEPRLSSDYDGEDSDIDGDQEYSDAAEDQSELEDRGAFASLDAIIESPQAEILEEPPVSPAAPKAVFKEASAFHPVDQPITAAPVGLAIGGPGMPSTEDEDWEKVREYWSGLSEQSKQQIEAAATPLPAKEQEGGSTTAPKSGTKKKRDGAVKQSSETVPLPPWPDREYQAQAVEAAGHERTKSDSQQQRKQPRENARSPMRSSLRGAEKPGPRTTQPTAPRPKAEKPQPLGTVTPSATTAKAIAQAIAARQGKPSLTRSDSVGSDSSFKKSRKAKSGEGKYSMRTSMRSQEANGKTAPAAKRESRPMSPDVNPRPAMRSSMRRNSVSSMESTQSTSRFSLFGRSSSKSRASAPKASKSTKKSGSTFASRFNDSDSDGEDIGRTNFRSRFADSDDSDDERPTRTSKLTPVRGIPRRNGQVSGDSTDLEDSDVEVADSRSYAVPVGAAAPVSVAAPDAKADQGHAHAGGNALTAGTLRDNNNNNNPEKRKSRSFFGFGKKKNNVETGSEIGSLPTSPIASTAPKLEDPVQASPGLDDRPLTPPNAIGLANGQNPVTPSSAQTVPTPTADMGMSPVALSKGGRKRSSSRASSIFKRWSMSAPTSPAQTAEHDGEFPGLGNAPAVPAIPDAYKLSPAAAAGSNKPRPLTSDGVGLAALTRPPLGGKRDSTMTAPESGTGIVNGDKKVIYSSRTGKKKKFQGLRRRLGIED